MTPKQEAQGIVPSINVPSADLIQYRFDQMEKRFDHLEGSLQTITSNFPSRSEVNMMARERDEQISAINKQLSNYQWYWRAIFVGVVGALATAIASFLIHN